MPLPHPGLKGEYRCGAEWAGTIPQTEQRHGAQQTASGQAVPPPATRVPLGHSGL